MFSTDLRTATRSIHRRAEGTPYLRALLGGRVNLMGYADMVAQHYLAYAALEEAAARLRSHPVVGVFAPAALDRVPALRADLQYLLGPTWANRVVPSRATQRYVARMREVCFDWPGGFVAHHYTRYMGDLSGGQAIRASVAQIYEFTDAGATFYDFPELGDLAVFKDRYRAALDAAPWSQKERGQILAEVLVAYQFTIDVLVELGTDLPDEGDC